MQNCIFVGNGNDIVVYISVVVRTKYFVCKEAYKLYSNIANVSTYDFLLNRIDVTIKQHIIDVEK